MDKNTKGLFNLKNYAKGEKFTIGLSDDNLIIFITHGRIVLTKRDQRQIMFESNTMFFCSKTLGPYLSTAEDDSVVVELSTNDILTFNDLIFINNIISIHSPNIIELEKLYIKDILRFFLSNIAYYHNQEITSPDLLNIKGREFIYLIRTLYEAKSLAHFFSPFSLSQSEFKSKILINYTTNSSVKELADMCFMTTKTFTRRFKAEFGITPYKWIVQQKVRDLEYALKHKNQPVEELINEFYFSNKTKLLHFCLKHNIKIETAKWEPL